MKTLTSFLSILAIGLLFAMPVYSQTKPAKNNPKSGGASITIPDDIVAVAKNSCMGCHSSTGEGLAKAKLNFTEWDKYKPAKQVKKAAAICKMVSGDHMPPKRFRDSHPDAVPTAAQKEMICKWAGTLSAKK